MPLGPFDEFLAHQTSETFDHVGTSDRNFYDRYYFNMHSSSDELFVITGLGQYPNLGVTDAMRASYEVTRQNLLMFTLFAVVLPLLAGLGAFACYVGLLVTYPLFFTIMAVAYRDCFGVPGARIFSQGAPPPPPSYATPYAPPPASAVCPNCHAEVPTGALFCIRCGNRMREE